MSNIARASGGRIPETRDVMTPADRNTRRIFDHATPEQLACFGVHPPGHPFWTEVTLKRAQARYPNWDLAPWRKSLQSQAVAPNPPSAEMQITSANTLIGT